MDEYWKRLTGISTFSASKPQPHENHGGDDAERVDGEEYDYSDDDDDDDDDDSYEDYDDDDFCDEKSGLGCPFCCENFDVVGLCCHIDVEHHKEVKAAICPVCVIKLEANMAVHLITQHEIILKNLRKKKFRYGGSCTALSFLKKELQDEYLQTRPKGSSTVDSSAGMENDSLFLPFFYHPQSFVKPETTNPSRDASFIRNSSQDCDSERDIKIPAFPDKNEEKAQRCEFLQGLLFSMIINDDDF